MPSIFGAVERAAEKIPTAAERAAESAPAATGKAATPIEATVGKAAATVTEAVRPKVMGAVKAGAEKLTKTTAGRAALAGAAAGVAAESLTEPDSKGEHGYGKAAIAGAGVFLAGRKSLPAMLKEVSENSRIDDVAIGMQSERLKIMHAVATDVASISKHVKDKRDLPLMTMLAEHSPDKPLEQVLIDLNNPKVHPELKTNPRYYGARLQDWKSMGELQDAVKRLAPAMEVLRGSYARMAAAGKSTGALKDLIEHYVNHMWDMTDTHTKQFFDQLQDNVRTGAMPDSVYKRIVSDYKFGVEQLGLKPKTLRADELMTAYHGSMGGLIAGQHAIMKLMNKTAPDGRPYAIMRSDLWKESTSHEIWQAEKEEKKAALAAAKQMVKDAKERGDAKALETARADRKAKLDDYKAHLKSGTRLPKTMAGEGYVAMPNNRMLKDVHFHPEIQSTVKAMFDTQGKGMLSALSSMSSAVKRSQVFLSVFHAKSLLESYLFMGGDPTKGFQAMRKATEKYLSKDPEAMRVVDEAIDHGLMLQHSSADFNSDSMNELLGHINNTANQYLGYDNIVGKMTRGIESINHDMDRLTFGYMLPALKLDLYMRHAEKLQRIAPERFKTPELRAAALREAASIANDAFGGQNWLMHAANTKSVLGRFGSLWLASRQGQQVAGLALFAPDWTLSTFRAGLKAMGVLPASVEERAMYQAYMVRTGLYWATAANVINTMLSGHPIWENKDPFSIETEDGSRIQYAKHANEFWHMLADPQRTVQNKESWLTQALQTATTGRTPNGYTVSKRKDMGYVIDLTEKIMSGAMPMWTGAQSIEGAVGGVFGMPMYAPRKTSE